MAKQEKWKVIPGQGDVGRYVVNQNNELIADCFADSSDEVGLLEYAVARRHARRIAMLPDMERLLIDLTDAQPHGCLWERAMTMVDKLMKLR